MDLVMVQNPLIPLDELRRPPLRRIGYREEQLRYLAMAGRMFAITVEQSHYEYDVTRRWPGSGPHS